MIRTVLALALALGCAAPALAQEEPTPIPEPETTPVPPPQSPEDKRKAKAKEDWGLEFSGTYFPIIHFEADIEDSAYDYHPRRRTDLEHDDGFAVRIAYAGPRDASLSDGMQYSFGLGYSFSEHSEKKRDIFCAVHSIWLDARATKAIPAGAPVQFAFGGSLGLGATVLDFSRDLNDYGGATIRASGLAGVRLFDHFEIRFEPGVLLTGYPTNTIGESAFVGFEARFIF